MPQQPRSHTTPFVALALTLSVGVVGIPSPSQAAQPPAPKLLPKMEPPAEQPAPAEQPPRAALRVDTQVKGGSDESLKAKIVEVATGVFGSEGFADALDDQDPRIVIVVEQTGDEENPGFVVGFSIEKGDEVVPGSARQSDCSLCTRTELVERIESELPALLKLALDHQPVRTVDDGGDGDGGDGDGGDGDVGPVDERNIGPMGFAGIGLGVVGAAGVGVGVGLAIKGFEPIPPTLLERKNYRTPGNVILAIGGAALIAGVVMIAVDVSKRKKARRAAQSGANLRWNGAGFDF